MMTSINKRSTSKKSKASMRNDGRDRLSELPDEILVHILSFLPILDAVRTVSICRFGNLWTLIPSLVFKETEFFVPKYWPGGAIDIDEQIPRFTRFVRNVLMLHKGLPVNKFLLEIDPIDDQEMVDLDVWIRFAIDRQVKELYVQFGPSGYSYDINLPRSVFTSQFLVILELIEGNIEGLSSVQMGSLRKLSLNCVKVSNEMLKKVIFGCPSLQELILYHAYDLDEVRFTAPNVEKLHIDSDQISVLDCPNLKILNVHLSCRTGSYLQVVNIPSVREVLISSMPQFDKFLNKICKAEVVKIQYEAFQQSNFKELDIPQTRWKCLHIESRLDEDQLIGICRVLRSSPYLEDLIVFTTLWGNLRRKSDKTHDHHMLSSPCVIPQLKTVTVPCQGLLRLAEFLLKSSVNLEKLVILPGPCNLVEKFKFMKQLCSFPRASTNARVIFGSDIY
ncbi:F-box/FBD/LRR-repeat protein At5g56420-like [Chenopodium quinoa]|uniref:F-box/FBD/LRR-repeat protein At5g56420-like n=1 Tax=Chenopodium quinoa TaxID=63459 RepID=UPI000B78C5B1|nr:F-box/FBD/LRR-repeat protein At5g56420-like [Chenopodium quinoa]